jgi:hypothetical protein
VALGLLLTIATVSASAQPALVAPANGASFARNAAITFTVTPVAGSADTTMQLSASPATNTFGALATPDPSFFGLLTASSNSYTWTPFEEPAGTYYWQAASFVCETTAPYSCPGDEYSPVQSIVLTPLPPPAPISPANDATVFAGAPTVVTFTPNAQDEDTKLYVLFSTSDTVGADGTLSPSPDSTGDLTGQEGLDTNSNVSVAIPEALNVPGTIYWQPVRVNCDDNPTAPCNVAGPVSALKLKKKPPPPPPPLHLQLSGGTTVRIRDPSISTTVTCSEACAGNVTVKASVRSGSETVADGLFDVGPSKFNVANGQQEHFHHAYTGSLLTKLGRAVAAHGYVELSVTVTATANNGGGKASAERTIFVRPNPPPPPPPAPKSAPPPTQSSTLDVHDLNDNVLAVTAYLFADPATPATQFDAPSSGDRLVAIRLNLTDRGPGTIDSDADGDTSFVGSNGQVYTPSFDDVQGCTNFDYGEFTLFDGESETGCVVFELPEAVGISRVAFTLGVDTAQWINNGGRAARHMASDGSPASRAKANSTPRNSPTAKRCVPHLRESAGVRERSFVYALGPSPRQ